MKKPGAWPGWHSFRAVPAARDGDEWAGKVALRSPNPAEIDLPFLQLTWQWGGTPSQLEGG